jgi:hypothetical protein
MTLLTLLQSPTGSGTIGTVSATLGAVTLASNGTLAAGASGTLSATLGALTLSSNATLATTVTGTLAGTLGGITLLAQGTLPGGEAPTKPGTGGWDPYAYKARKRRRTRLEDVRAFMADVMGRDLDDAPPAVVAQAEDATRAAEAVLAITPTGMDDEVQARLAQALTEIDTFYRLIREQVRLARLADEEEDEELLLLH